MGGRWQVYSSSIPDFSLAKSVSMMDRFLSSSVPSKGRRRFFVVRQAPVSRRSPPCYRHFIGDSVCDSVGEYVSGDIHRNGIESFWAILKRGYYGVFHHFTWKHVHRYLAEFEHVGT